MNTLPSTIDDASVSIQIGAAIRAMVDPLVDDTILTEDLRMAAEVIVASFMLPLLAREDRIAAYLGHDAQRVRKMGWRLRVAEIWTGTRLAADCYDALMEDDPFGANLSLMLFACVAVGKFHAKRRDDGEIMYSRQRQLAPVHVEGIQCAKCLTTTRYGQTGACVECRQRYARGYSLRKQAKESNHVA